MTTSKTIQRPWLFDFWAFIVFGFRNEFLVSGVEPWNLKIAQILWVFLDMAASWLFFFAKRFFFECFLTFLILSCM